VKARSPVRAPRLRFECVDLSCFRCLAESLVRLGVAVLDWLWGGGGRFKSHSLRDHVGEVWICAVVVACARSEPFGSDAHGVGLMV
jgi:hypothetical protein